MKLYRSQIDLTIPALYNYEFQIQLDELISYPLCQYSLTSYAPPLPIS